MTVKTKYQPKSYKPGAVPSAQGIGFEYLSADDIKVTHVDANTGIEAAVVRDVHYRLGGDGATATGTITSIGSWPADDLFVIERVTADDQAADLDPDVKLAVRDIERSLDKQAMRSQEKASTIARTLRVPREEVGIELVRAALRAGMFLAFDANGDAIMSSGTGTDAGLRGDMASGLIGARLLAMPGGGTVADYQFEISAQALGLQIDTELDADGLPILYKPNADAIEAALDEAYQRGVRRVRFSGGKGAIAIDRTIQLGLGLELLGEPPRGESKAQGEIGETLRIVPTPDGTYNTRLSGVTVTGSQAAETTQAVAGQTVVPFGCRVSAASGLVVKIGNAVKVLNADYTVDMQASEVTFAEPLTEGATVTIRPETGYLFFANVDPANTATWKRQFPALATARFAHLSIDGRPTNGISVCYFAGTVEARDMRLRNVATLLRKPSGTYTDGLVVEDIHCDFRANPDDFLLDLLGTGDGYRLSGIASGYTGDQTGVAKCLRLGQVRGTLVDSIINGIIEARGSAFKFEQNHLEGGQIFVDQGFPILEGNNFYNGEGALVPVVVRNSAGIFGGAMHLALRDNQWFHLGNPVADIDGWAKQAQLDVQFETSRVLVDWGTGNVRVPTYNGNLSKAMLLAPQIGYVDANGKHTVYAGWRSLAHMLSAQGTSIGWNDSSPFIRQNGTMAELQPWNGISTIPFAAPAGTKFTAPSGDYRYKYILLSDYERMIGRHAAANAEVTITQTKDSRELREMRLAFEGNRNGELAVLALRADPGTAAGEWDWQALIHLIAGRDFVDLGHAIASIAWEEYEPAGEPQVNSGHVGALQYAGGLLRATNVSSTAPPAVGFHHQGDSYRNKSANAGDHAEQICVASGEGGGASWQKLGVIGLVRAAAPASTYAAPAGGTTIDAEARATIAQLAADVADLRTKLKTANITA